jgi:DNA modification methylase
MGKSWDSSGIAFNVEVWTEALRVLKPGGHLIAFSGSRTYHRMAVAIEDAGFEIRDQIMWIYGSGFPKSHNISKGIDKSDAGIARRERDFKFTAWMRSTGITAKRIDEVTQTMMGSHYTTHPTQPAVATAEMFDKLRSYLPEVPDWVEEMVRQRTIESENFKKREVVGTKPSSLGGTVAAGERNQEIIEYHKNKIVDITAPATDAAKQWDGWGTALKPAHEPMVLARKPLIGTVANNVLTYGVGGLNIDASRVGYVDENDGGDWERFANHQSSKSIRKNMTQNGQGLLNGRVDNGKQEGRWPANIIHDGSDEVVEYFGEPARFFYCAKASKRDRNEGLDGFPEIKGGSMSGVETRKGKPTNQPIRANHHPTVKPTNLMRYLCKLVTPPKGIVLDPFMGSGSTGKAAILESFDFIGIDMTPEYVEIAKARIEWIKDQGKDYLL